MKLENTDTAFTSYPQ